MFLQVYHGIYPNVSHSALMVGKQLAEEKDEVIKPLSESFTATILSAATETRQRHLHPVKKRFLLPAAVAATLAIVTLFSFVWLANPPQPSLFPESQLFSLASLEKREQAVQKFMGQIESPIQREARQLKKSFQSATSFLISCLDLKISTSQTL